MAGDVGTIVLLTISTVSLVCMLTFNALSGSGTGGDLFVCSVSDASDLYQTYITPAGKTFLSELGSLPIRVYDKISVQMQPNTYFLSYHLF